MIMIKIIHSDTHECMFSTNIVDYLAYESWYSNSASSVVYWVYFKNCCNGELNTIAQLSLNKENGGNDVNKGIYHQICDLVYNGRDKYGDDYTIVLSDKGVVDIIVNGEKISENVVIKT